VLIVREAFAGKRRFGEFEKGLGVAKNILTVRLRKLVSLGVLEQVPGEGPYHEYALTEKGRGLYLVLTAIRQCDEGCGGDAPYVLVDRRDGKPVTLLAFHAHDGRHPVGREPESLNGFAATKWLCRAARVAEPEARTRTGTPGPVTGVREFAPAQRQATAADAAGQSRPQSL
jgi:hypothetical protein